MQRTSERKGPRPSPRRPLQPADSLARRHSNAVSGSRRQHCDRKQCEPGHEQQRRHEYELGDHAVMLARAAVNIASSNVSSSESALDSAAISVPSSRRAQSRARSALRYVRKSE
jgi:hypothetical protein